MAGEQKQEDGTMIKSFQNIYKPSIVCILFSKTKVFYFY